MQDDLIATNDPGFSEDVFTVKAVDRRLSRHYVNSSSLVLDVGGARGIDAAPMALTAKAVIVLDINKHALLEGKRTFVSIEFVCGSGVSLPFRNESFEFLTLFSALDHFPSDEAVTEAVGQFRRVLKKGGKLAITVPNVLFMPVTLLMFLKRLRGSTLERRRFNPRQLHKLVISLGLNLIRNDGEFPQLVGTRLMWWLFSTRPKDNAKIRSIASKKIIMTTTTCVTKILSVIFGVKLLAPRYGILAEKPAIDCTEES